MKKSLLALTLFLSPFTALAADCTGLVYQASNRDHTIMFSACLLNTGDFRVQQTSMTNGRVIDQLDAPARNTSYVVHNAGNVSLKEFNLTQGERKYNMMSGTDSQGRPIASVTIDVNEDRRNLIDVDTDTVLNYITHGLADFGVEESDEL